MQAPAVHSAFDDARTPENLAKFILYDLLLALEYFHEGAGMIDTGIHLSAMQWRAYFRHYLIDVKPSNIMTALSGAKASHFEVNPSHPQSYNFSFVAVGAKLVTIWRSIGYILDISAKPDSWNLTFKLGDLCVGAHLNCMPKEYELTHSKLVTRIEYSIISLILSGCSLAALPRSTR